MRGPELVVSQILSQSAGGHKLGARDLDSSPSPPSSISPSSMHSYRLHTQASLATTVRTSPPGGAKSDAGRLDERTMQANWDAL